MAKLGQVTLGQLIFCLFVYQPTLSWAVRMVAKHLDYTANNVEFQG